MHSLSPRLACEGGRPVRPEFLVFGRPALGEEEIVEIVDTLRSGWIGFGPKCLRFESEFAEYTGARHALSVNSCTAALHLALLAANIGPGDEVITTPLTFCATSNVITHVGAIPVFVDVDPLTQNLDPTRIEAVIGERTRAIMVVHMAGWPCDMAAIEAIAARHGLEVIEDAAHATESWHRGRKIGSLSRFTAFSFYATKNLTTGEGGMLTVNDDAALDRLKALRLHGLDKDAWKRYSPGGFLPYETLEPGYKYNMTDLQASLGIHQLARLESQLEVRDRLWAAYDAMLGGEETVEVPQTLAEPGSRHARHLYTVRLRLEHLEIDRTDFVRALAAENIGTGVHFVPIHLHRWYRERWGYERGDFPIAESIGDATISLPLSPAMTEADVADVAAAVKKVAHHYATRGVGVTGWNTEPADRREAA